MVFRSSIFDLELPYKECTNNNSKTKVAFCPQHLLKCNLDIVSVSIDTILCILLKDIRYNISREIFWPNFKQKSNLRNFPSNFLVIFLEIYLVIYPLFLDPSDQQALNFHWKDIRTATRNHYINLASIKIKLKLCRMLV